MGNSGGTLGAGIDNFHGTATLTDCTIAGNFNAEFGGGIYNSGTLTVINSTIADNSSEYGAGIDNSDTVTLINSTLAGNTAQQAGGGINNGNSVTLTDTIIATNAVTATAGTGPDVAGSFTSDGYNLVGETDGSSGWINSDKTGSVAQPLNPLLAPLGDYGGPTETLALLPHSPAIGAAPAPTTPARIARSAATSAALRPIHPYPTSVRSRPSPGWSSTPRSTAQARHRET